MRKREHSYCHWEPDNYKVCPNCKAKHQNSGAFCSRKCANKRVLSEETKQQIGKSLNSSEKFKSAVTSKVFREKVSLGRRKFLEENPDQVPYRLNHSSKESYSEKIFREGLERHLITGWIQEMNFSIYRLDFAFPAIKLDVEIDGETHLTENVKLIDERRDNFLRSREWEVLRFTAKELKHNFDNCIHKLKEKIGTLKTR